MVVPFGAGCDVCLLLHSTPTPQIYPESVLRDHLFIAWRKCNTVRAHWDIPWWAAIPFYVNEPWESPPCFGLSLLNAVAPVQRIKGNNCVYPTLASRGSMSSEMLPLSGPAFY